MKHVGLEGSSKRLLHIELSPQDWPRLGPLLEYFQSSGRSRQVYGAKSNIIELPQGNIGEGVTIMHQRHLKAHMAYGLKGETISYSEIETINYKVEVRLSLIHI